MSFTTVFAVARAMLYLLKCLIRQPSETRELGLVERKYQVFWAARTLVSEVTRKGHVDSDDIADFDLGVADAPALFGPKVQTYLDDLRTKMIALLTSSEQLNAMSANDRGRDVLVDLIGRSKSEIATEFEKTAVVFLPYLMTDWRSVDGLKGNG
jgi:hypothetical protein